MKTSVEDFAVAGGTRTFDPALSLGQGHFPSWEEYESAMSGIVSRRYYTNHGPLIRELESRLESMLGVGNVITVANEMIGMYMVHLALEVGGKLLVPSLSPSGVPRAVHLAGVETVPCTVDPRSYMLTAGTIAPNLTADVGAICVTNIWGGSSDVSALEQLASQHAKELIFDSCHGMKVSNSRGMLGQFGHAEVFSFGSDALLSAAEGGCICTNDDELAEALRNIRSNYGIRRVVQVPLTINARMSEAQAAVALLSLDHIDEYIDHNRVLFDIYVTELSGHPGLRVQLPTNIVSTNHQNLVVKVSSPDLGMSVQTLSEVLRQEGVNTLVHSVGTDARDQQDAVLELPIGELVSREAVKKTVELLWDVYRHADGLARSA